MMNRTEPLKYRLKCLGCLFVIQAVLYAAQEDIRYTADISHLPAGANIAALGDAGVVLPQRAVASFWNPASSSMIRNFEISFEGAELYGGLSRQACLTVHAPVPENIGITIIYLPYYSGKIERYDSLPGTYQERIMTADKSVFGTPKGYFRNNQHLVLCSMGKMFTFQLPRLSGIGLPLFVEICTGVSVKGLWHMMDPDGQLMLGTGFNADLGVLTRIAIDYDLYRKESIRHVMLAASFRNVLPSSVVWINSLEDYSEKYALTQSYGISYTDRSGFLHGNWTVALALTKNVALSYHAGIETEYWNLVSFRVGISDKIPVLGAGIHYKRIFTDYALRFDRVEFSYIRLSVGFIF